MVHPMLRTCCLLLCCAAAACGRSDTYVVGGFVADTTQPVVILDPIRSAISGEVTPTDSSGQPAGSKVSVVVLSTAPDLCAKLKANRSYFRAPTEAFVALVLYAPLDKSGTFYVGRTTDVGTSAEVITTAGPTDGGTATPLDLFAVTGSSVSLSEFALREPGNAKGGFAAVFQDVGSVQRELYGRFKSNTCDGFDTALLP